MSVPFHRVQGFECSGAVGKDVAQLLQDALDRKHIHVRCVCLVNDTCGSLMASAYERGDCLCGGIFGTGTNGAYVEDMAKITKMGHSDDALADAKKTGLDKMVVNTECEPPCALPRTCCPVAHSLCVVVRGSV